MSEAPAGAVFEARGLIYRYPARASSAGEPPAIDSLDLTVPPGSLYAVLGPNGSGKSTLVRLCLGALRPEEGVISHAGRPLGDWPRRELARRIGVLPQLEQVTFPLTVRELVSMGRYPHLGPWQAEGAADRAAVERAMEECEVSRLAGRRLGTLSGGERQRARLARALAQEPAVLVLDEPTAALDIHHEMAMFELVRLLVEHGKTVLLTTHNINLAARYASHILVLERGCAVAQGAPGEVIDADLISRVYHWPVAVVPHPGPGSDAGAPQVLPLAPRGEDRTKTAPAPTPPPR